MYSVLVIAVLYKYNGVPVPGPCTELGGPAPRPLYSRTVYSVVEDTHAALVLVHCTTR